MTQVNISKIFLDLNQMSDITIKYTSKLTIFKTAKWCLKLGKYIKSKLP